LILTENQICCDAENQQVTLRVKFATPVSTPNGATVLL